MIEAAVRRQVIATLAGAPALTGAINGVFESGTAGLNPPYVAVGAVTAQDWGAKDRDGREITVTVRVHDAAREADRAAALASEVAIAVTGMARSFDGVEIGSVRLRRSDIRRSGAGEWIATSDFRLRALAAG